MFPTRGFKENVFYALSARSPGFRKRTLGYQVLMNEGRLLNQTKRVSRLSTIYGQNLPETTKDYYNVSKSTSLNKILTPLSRNPCFIKPMIYVPACQLCFQFTTSVPHYVAGCTHYSYQVKRVKKTKRKKNLPLGKFQP